MIGNYKDQYPVLLELAKECKEYGRPIFWGDKNIDPEVVIELLTQLVAAETALLQSQARESAMRELLKECSEGFYAEYSSNSTSNKIDNFLASDNVGADLLAKKERMQTTLQTITEIGNQDCSDHDKYVLAKTFAQKALKGEPMQNAHEQFINTGDAKLAKMQKVVEAARNQAAYKKHYKEMESCPECRYYSHLGGIYPCFKHNIVNPEWEKIDELICKALAELDKP